jgi:hypothetical protein
MCRYALRRHITSDGTKVVTVGRVLGKLEPDAEAEAGKEVPATSP